MAVDGRIVRVKRVQRLDDGGRSQGVPRDHHQGGLHDELPVHRELFHGDGHGDGGAQLDGRHGVLRGGQGLLDGVVAASCRDPGGPGLIGRDEGRLALVRIIVRVIFDVFRVQRGLGLLTGGLQVVAVPGIEGDAGVGHFVEGIALRQRLVRIPAAEAAVPHRGGGRSAHRAARLPGDGHYLGAVREPAAVGVQGDGGVAVAGVDAAALAQVQGQAFQGGEHEVHPVRAGLAHMAVIRAESIAGSDTVLVRRVVEGGHVLILPAAAGLPVEITAADVLVFSAPGYKDQVSTVVNSRNTSVIVND